MLRKFPLGSSRLSDVRRRRDCATQAFATCRDGSILPIIALSALALVAATGLALDGSRLMLMNSTLQSAIDAGGLSAVAKMSTTEVQTEVKKFAETNFANGYVNATITQLNAVTSADKKKLTITATAEAPTVFMGIFGMPKITSTASSEITRKTSGLELALVLDVTGSMKGEKLSSLKLAAKDLLNIVFGSDTTATNLFVGVVPFASGIKIGTTRPGWLTASPVNWNGCVEERFDGYDTSDEPPKVKLFPQMTSSCSPEMTPLTSKKDIVTTAIDNLAADGSTFVNVGAVWGWRMLSPKWRGVWGGTMTGAQPLPYGTEGMTKAVVIMTDGENMYSSGGAFGRTTKECVRTFFNLFCLEQRNTTDARLGAKAPITGDSKADEEAFAAATTSVLNARLATVCKSMGDAGIKVFTVAFGSPGSEIQDLLRKCASNDSLYFNSPNAADLRTAFKTIGDALSNLRVSR